MSEMRGWLQAVAVAHATGADTWAANGVAVQRVTGGANNALYRLEVDGQSYACKLCVADERRRAAREHGALCLLQAAGLDIAPQPIVLDESCALLPFPAVVYRWLAGEPLGPSLTAQQLAALLDSIQQMHTLQPNDHAAANLPTAWFHWFDFTPYLSELHAFLSKYGPWLAASFPDGQVLQVRLGRLVDSCTEAMLTSGVDPDRDRVPLCLCHVDLNLANAIWSEDGRLRWVDWEYSGWGDPALELADLRWHGALAGLSEAQHAWLRAGYRRPTGDPAFAARLAVWDRLLATRWPFLVARWLWSQDHGPDRLRLTPFTAAPAELYARLVRFIERAECLADSQR